MWRVHPSSRASHRRRDPDCGLVLWRGGSRRSVVRKAPSPPTRTGKKMSTTQAVSSYPLLDTYTGYGASHSVAVELMAPCFVVSLFTQAIPLLDPPAEFLGSNRDGACTCFCLGLFAPMATRACGRSCPRACGRSCPRATTFGPR